MTKKIDEEWADVKGYEGLYWVNRSGQVKSLKKIKKPATSNKGYLIVEIYKDNKRKKLLVHRLVAQAFIPNPNNYPNVCHKDDNPKNNEVNNLFWGTQKMNVQDMMSKKRGGYKAHLGESNTTSKLTNKQVYWARQQVALGATCAEIARVFNVDRTTISHIKRGLTWSHLK